MGCVFSIKIVHDTDAKDDSKDDAKDDSKDDAKDNAKDNAKDDTDEESYQIDSPDQEYKKDPNDR